MANDTNRYALVADDDGIIRMDALTILEDAGFDALEASNVEEALAELERHGDAIKILFTDVHMPPSERDGFELARLCAVGWPHVAIIVASGAAEPKEGDLPEGATFIRKPFSPEIVQDHLKRVLPSDAAA